MINWNQRNRIFSDPDSCFITTPPLIYIDEEITAPNSSCNRQKIAKIFDGLQKEISSSGDIFSTNEMLIINSNRFNLKSFKKYNKSLLSLRLDFFWGTDDNDDLAWAGLYESGGAALLVGNYNNHPFVATSEFSFGNTDSSTITNTLFFQKRDLKISEIVHFLEISTIEYLFYQKH